MQNVKRRTFTWNEVSSYAVVFFRYSSNGCGCLVHISADSVVAVNHAYVAVLLSSEWCCLASAFLRKLPSIAFLHQRTNQAPRSRYTVAPSRAHSHHRPGRCDGGGPPENGGQRNRSGCWIHGLLRGKSPGCDETLIKVRHTQAHAHHKRACLALQLCVFFPASVRGLNAHNHR